MRIDTSNDSVSADRDYSRVLLQQGRPLLDHDWNEHSSIVAGQMRAAVRAIYGEHGGPAGLKCGFVPYIGDSGLQLRRGFYTVDGFTVTCPAGSEPASTDPHTGDAVVALPADPGRYLMYLEVVETTETAAINGRLSERALPGIDLAARARLSSRVRFEALKTVSPAPLIQTWLDAYDHANPAVPPVTVPMSILAERAQARPNQLLRLERHSHAETGWKLSDNNSFALFSVLAQDGGSSTPGQVPRPRLTIDVGSLAGWTPSKGQYVELLTREQLAFEEPGELHCVRRADHAHPDMGQSGRARMICEIELESSKASPAKAEFLRVWDAVVQFADATAQVGDYWLLPARLGQDVGNEARFHRPVRRLAPLALLELSADREPDIVRRYQRAVGVPWRDVDQDFEGLPRKVKTGGA